jgi:hypothetical protein
MIDLPLPDHLTRCLAHPEGWKVKRSPDQWCDRRNHCARHQTIAVDPFDGTSDVVPRACTSELMSQHIPLEGFPPKDEA